MSQNYRDMFINGGGTSRPIYGAVGDRPGDNKEEAVRVRYGLDGRRRKLENSLLGGVPQTTFRSVFLQINTNVQVSMIWKYLIRSSVYLTSKHKICVEGAAY